MNDTAQSLRQILWLPDECLRLASYGGHLGAGRLCRDRRRRRRRSRHPQHLPYPREGGREGLFRARPRARDERRRGRRRAAMSSSRSPAASRRPKARRSSAARPWSIWCSARRAITVCLSFWTAPSATAKPSTPNFRPTTSSIISRQPSPAAIRARGVSAFVTVQEGCDKFCTFCVVPYTRGAEVSRPVQKVLAEIEHLAAAGVREITLIGQNVNAYHGDGPDGRPWSLPRLLERAAQIGGIARLRYTTSHPRDMDDDLIAAHRDLPALMPQLHLPVQSGSDRILAAMNRRHSRADYLDIVRRLRARAARSRADVRLHCRLSRRDRTRFRRHAEPDRRSRIFRLVLVQIFAAARHARRRDGRSGARRSEVGAAAAPAGRHRPPAGRVQSKLRRPHASTCCSKSPAGITARSSAVRPICNRCRSKRRHR